MKSVKSTQQITKAMKMVSAAKLRRAQQAITQMRPYANKLNEMLTNILSTLDGDASTTFGTERPVAKVLVVVVTSNRGLAGAFNTNVIKKAVALIEEKYVSQRDNGNLTVMCIGKKGNDFFRRNYPNVERIEEYVEVFSDLSFDNIALISQQIMDDFEAGTYDAVEAVYGRFKNAGMQFPEAVQFLPVSQKLWVEQLLWRANRSIKNTPFRCSDTVELVSTVFFMIKKKKNDKSNCYSPF